MCSGVSVKIFRGHKCICYKIKLEWKGFLVLWIAIKSQWKKMMTSYDPGQKCKLKMGMFTVTFDMATISSNDQRNTRKNNKLGFVNTTQT